MLSSVLIAWHAFENTASGYDACFCAHSYTRHKTRHKFFNAGIAATDGTGHSQPGSLANFYKIPAKYKTLSLETLMKEMGTNHVDVVRMDTEGAEWPVLESWLDAGLLDKIDQVSLEIHMDKLHLLSQMRTFSRLVDQDKVVWSQSNRYSATTIPDTPLLPVWELSLWNNRWMQGYFHK